MKTVQITQNFRGFFSISLRFHDQILTWRKWDHLGGIPLQTKKYIFTTDGNMTTNIESNLILKSVKNDFVSITKLFGYF